MDSNMWQDWVVYAVVALAGGYALWYWMPAALRQRLRLGKAPACGACSDCGGCTSGKAPMPPRSSPR